MPNKEERYDLMKTICLSHQITMKAEEVDLTKIASRTEGFSHRDMRNLMEKAFQVKLVITVSGLQLLFQIGPEQIVYRARHYTVEITNDGFDTFHPCCCNSVEKCGGIELHFSEIPEEVLKVKNCMHDIKCMFNIFSGLM